MKKILVIIFYLGLNTSQYAQNKSDSTLILFYQEIIKTLSSDSLQGRTTGSIYEKKATLFIANQIKKNKLKSKIQHFAFQHPDSNVINKSQNIYCYINNKADSTIILGAHYDHIGLGGPLSRSIGKKAIHPGADDNASGIALLLGLVSEQKKWNNSNYNYLFVAYSAHEIGLYGSKCFANFAPKKYGPIALVINFDMVGRMNPELKWLKIFGADTNKASWDFFKQENPNIRYKFEPDSMLTLLDTKTFYEKNVPCVSFTTGIHNDYHKTSDLESKINYLGILNIQRMIEMWIKTQIYHGSLPHRY